MKVILTQDVRGQGKKGQLIDAAEGYARNFLLPRKLAVLATGGREGRLFGAITSKEISDGLASQFQLDVPKQKIVLDEPIKAFGTYEVKAKLGYEVSARFSVSVSEE